MPAGPTLTSKALDCLRLLSTRASGGEMPNHRELQPGAKFCNECGTKVE
jgi:hypothetical protein